MSNTDEVEMNHYPFIETVARAIAVADEQEEEDWESFEDLAIAAIRAIKNWVESDS